MEPGASSPSECRRFSPPALLQQRQGQALIRRSDPKKLIASLDGFADAVAASMYGSTKLQRSDSATFRRYAFDFSQSDTYAAADIEKLITDAKRMPAALDLA